MQNQTLHYCKYLHLMTRSPAPWMSVLNTNTVQPHHLCIGGLEIIDMAWLSIPCASSAPCAASQAIACGSPYAHHFTLGVVTTVNMDPAARPASLRPDAVLRSGPTPATTALPKPASHAGCSRRARAQRSLVSQDPQGQRQGQGTSRARASLHPEDSALGYLLVSPCSSSPAAAAAGSTPWLATLPGQLNHQASR